jgi:hypothetical protein
MAIGINLLSEICRRLIQIDPRMMLRLQNLLRKPPTTKHSGYEDNAEHVVIDRLLYQAVVEAKEIAYSSTDYGICTQSTTTRMILRIRLHRSSVNVSARFMNQNAVKRRK